MSRCRDDAGRRERANAAARILYAMGARRVWLFGSLARGLLPDHLSDIDIAVEGLPLCLVDQAKRRVRRATGQITDVVPLETAPPDIRGAAVRARIALPSSSAGGAPGKPAALYWAGPCASQRERRFGAVIDILRRAGVRSVLDVGCGRGRLIEELAEDGSFHRIGGMDKDDEAVAATRARLVKAGFRSGLPLEVWQGLFTHRDARLRGWQAIVAVEVIEHLEHAQRAAFEDVVFAFARPAVAIVTTPNADYNRRWGLDGMRHADHRFEWTRAQFAEWCQSIGRRYEYRPRILPVGPFHEIDGAPTQLVAFRLA